MTTSANRSSANANNRNVSFEDVVEQLASLKSDIQKLSSQFVNYVGQEGESLGEFARKTASDLGSTLSSYGIDAEGLARTARERGDEVRRAALKEMRRNPAQSAAILIGVGLILGALIRRR